MKHTNETLRLRVNRIRAEAKGILSIELNDPQQAELPAFTPGAHLELRLPGGHRRHYSLFNDPSERNRYLIAVSLAANSRGGSQHIHSSLREGDMVTSSAPRNNFALADTAGCYCFVAGGIGITPLMSMIRWCVTQGKDWRLIYTARSSHRAAFYEDLQALSTKRVQCHFTEESGGRLDHQALIASLAADEHLFCCGPDSLMQALLTAGKAVSNRLHFEWFSPPETLPQAHSADEGFELILRKSGKVLRVPPQQSILETLESHGLEVPWSCRAGICRSCETAVCSGTPEHLDLVLSDEERTSNQSMLICVSRAVTPSLELNL
ncbi:MAG: PDR/VanB family oxidoreductase [Pseudomonas sp.]|uniref:PDR/VanB family oxidoreductase n=1 Tax=Pseudomonas sp. TaxID=306 RepID=UPI0039828D1F